jgi:anaerobic ribonucleoside-triphosphate reductase activating protein
VASVVDETEAEGPGARFALWVQGCAIRCPGCCNPHMFPSRGGEPTAPAALLARLDAARRRAGGRLEGVTLLGGEPFEQAEALLPFVTGVRARGLGVVAFTGYHLEGLRDDRPPGSRALLAEVDLLVDGPFVASRPERERRWAGSSNQRFHFLTDRYAPGVESIREGGPERTVELRLGADGRVDVSGWPEDAGLATPGASSPSSSRAAGSTRRSSRARSRGRARARGRRSP